MRTARKTVPGSAGLTPERVDVQHALGLRVAHDAALEVRQLGQLHEVGAAVGPRLAAVVAPHDAADLHRRVERLRPRGIGGHAHHAAGERHLHALGLDRRSAAAATCRRRRRCGRRRPARCPRTAAARRAGCTRIDHTCRPRLRERRAAPSCRRRRGCDRGRPASRCRRCRARSGCTVMAMTWTASGSPLVSGSQPPSPTRRKMPLRLPAVNCPAPTKTRDALVMLAPSLGAASGPTRRGACRRRG